MDDLLKSIKLEHDLLAIACAPTPDHVGLELISSKVFVNHIKEMVIKSTDLVKKLKGLNDVRIELLTPSDISLNKSVTRYPFSKVSKNELYKPEGFKGYMGDLANLLLINSEKLFDIPQLLEDANRAFSEYVMEPKGLAKFDSTVLPVPPDMSKFVNRLSDLFKGKEGIGTDLMSNLYRSFGNCVDVTQSVYSLTSKFNGFSTEVIRGRMGVLYETLSNLIVIMQKENITVSKSVAKKLGNLVYKLADHIAIYSLYLTKLHALANSHKRNCDKLNCL